MEIFINTSYDASGQISEEIETWSSKPGSKREIDWQFTRTFTWDQIEIESETYAESDTESDLEADTEAGSEDEGPAPAETPSDSVSA